MPRKRSNTFCKIEGCEKPSRLSGMCIMHFRRWQRKGDPLAEKRAKTTPEERFWTFVNKTDDCWFWTGYCTEKGYGHFNKAVGSIVRAHRFAYLLIKGEIPDGMVLDHLCRVRACVNPDHLEVVTAFENNRRAGAVSHVGKRS